ALRPLRLLCDPCGSVSPPVSFPPASLFHVHPVPRVAVQL
ncbi:MAG: hypothetical protein AVDCRST_MAG56-7145, partial [uncultured Cytophagales bacterium]